MPLYHLHVRDGTSEILDPEGSELGSLDELRDYVLRSARELMLCGIHRGVLDLRFRIDAEDANGNVVYTLPFTHALSIIPETAAGSEYAVPALLASRPIMPGVRIRR